MNLRRTALLSLALLAFLPAAGAEAGASLRIGYLYGQNEYDGEGGIKALAKWMETDHGARSFYFHAPDVNTDVSEATATVLPNIHELDSLDVLVLFVRRVWLNQAQLAKMKAFLNSGKGIVGIRAAQYAIQSWDAGRGIDTAVLGGSYNSHGSALGYDLEFTAAAKASPILASVKPWRAGDKLYYQDFQGKPVAADCSILLYGVQGSVRHPVAWTRVRMGSNIFVTTTGVPEDFKNAEFRRMMVNATLWAGKALVPTSLPGSIGRNRISGNRDRESKAGNPGHLADGRTVIREGGQPFLFRASQKQDHAGD